MPNADPYLVGCFHSLGLYLNTGMGMAPLSWQEIDAYSRVSFVNLSGWEAVQLINMSRQYCSWYNKGKKVDCVSPWNDNSEAAIQANRERISKSMKSLRGKRDR